MHIVLDGHSLTVAGVIAAARYGASVALDQSPEIQERMAKSRDVLVEKVQANKSVYGISTGLGGSGACHALISRVPSTKTPHRRILDRAKTCRTTAGYSGHADEPHDRPWIRPHPASPHRCTAIPSVITGHASCTSAIRPARRDEHARGVGPRRDPCAHQLAHPWPLGCALGTTREDGHTAT
jgi:hypothetical protein